MNVRTNPYYCISCEQDSDFRMIEIDATKPSEIVSLVVNHFGDKFTPPKDDRGNVVSGKPFTELAISYCDSSKDINKVLKQGRIYDYRPNDIISELTKLINRRP